MPMLKQVKQIRGDSFVHPQSIYKTYEELFDGEIWKENQNLDASRVLGTDNSNQQRNKFDNALSMHDHIMLLLYCKIITSKKWWGYIEG